MQLDLSCLTGSVRNDEACATDVKLYSESLLLTCDNSYLGEMVPPFSLNIQSTTSLCNSVIV